MATMTSTSTVLIEKSTLFRKRMGYRVVLGVILALVGLEIFFSMELWFIKTMRPEPDYFIMDANLSVTPIRPLTRPTLSLSQLLVWVMQASTASYTFDFLNVEDQLASIKTFFTDAGYDSYMASLQHNNLLDQVRQGKLIVSSVPTGMPVVVNEAAQPPNGYTWQIQIPLRISFQSANESRFIDSVQSITVERISTTDSPRGVGISQILMSTSNASR